MASKKTKRGPRMKPHYVKTKKRGSGSKAHVQRSTTIIMLVVILLAILTSVFMGFRWINRQLYADNPRFEIQHLEISSDGGLSEELIREYTQLKEGMNLFSFTFEEIEEHLLSVPIVESVWLERRLPNTLVLKVKERVPMVRIAGPNNARLLYVLDRHGVIFVPRKSESHLPLIVNADEELRPGQEAKHPDIPIVLRIVALCQSVDYLRNKIQLDAFDLKYGDYIEMKLNKETRVRMSRYQEKKKLQDLATLIEIAQNQGKRVKEVDLTLDSSKIPVVYY